MKSKKKILLQKSINPQYFQHLIYEITTVNFKNLSLNVLQLSDPFVHEKTL